MEMYSPVTLPSIRDSDNKWVNKVIDPRLPIRHLGCQSFEKIQKCAPFLDGQGAGSTLAPEHPELEII